MVDRFESPLAIARAHNLTIVIGDFRGIFFFGERAPLRRTESKLGPIEILAGTGEGIACRSMLCLPRPPT
jgi:hypothetical protein